MSNSLPQEVYWALRDVSQSIRKRLHNKLADWGLTWPQYHALYHILDEGIPANELARELNCNASNMTGLIDRMIENNWVYREHSQEDRRVWLIKLTDEGRNLRERMIPQYKRNIEKEMSVLSEEEMKQLLELLKKLI